MRFLRVRSEPVRTESDGTESVDGDAAALPAPADAVAPRPTPASRQKPAVRRVNALARGVAAQTYLEIGVAEGETFVQVEVPTRTGVDPTFLFDTSAHVNDRTTLLPITSDEYFTSLAPNVTFDLIFLDGLHTFEQSYRDLCSALLHSQSRTVILIDDTVPSDVYSALPDRARALRFRGRSESTKRGWHGDVYKVVLAIHDYHIGLNYRTLVGSGNPQTLVWRESGCYREPHFPSFEEISRFSYFDLVDNFALMQTGSEDEAIELCMQALTESTPITSQE
jgi:hypothetical protein